MRGVGLQGVWSSGGGRAALFYSARLRLAARTALPRSACEEASSESPFRWGEHRLSPVGGWQTPHHRGRRSGSLFASEARQRRARSEAEPGGVNKAGSPKGPTAWANRPCPSKSPLARLDDRDHELRARRERAEVEVGVVLDEEPHRDLVALAGELPERVAAAEHVGRGPRHLEGVEELLLQRAVVLEPPLLEDLGRHAAEVELA